MPPSIRKGCILSDCTYHRGISERKGCGMAIDQTSIGNVAARLMENLESKYGDDAEIKTVLLLVAVEHSAGTQDTIEFSVSEGVSKQEGVGILEIIKHSLLNG